MFVKDWRNGWPYLFTVASGPLALALQAYLANVDRLDSLTNAVAAPHKGVIFAIAFVVVGVLLARIALPRRARKSDLVPAE
jgi:hypothetical protein